MSHWRGFTCQGGQQPHSTRPLMYMNEHAPLYPNTQMFVVNGNNHGQQNQLPGPNGSGVYFAGRTNSLVQPRMIQNINDVGYRHIAQGSYDSGIQRPPYVIPVQPRLMEPSYEHTFNVQRASYPDHWHPRQIPTIQGQGNYRPMISSNGSQTRQQKFPLQRANCFNIVPRHFSAQSCNQHIQTSIQHNQKFPKKVHSSVFKPIGTQSRNHSFNARSDKNQVSKIPMPEVINVFNQITEDKKIDILKSGQCGQNINKALHSVVTSASQELDQLKKSEFESCEIQIKDMEILIDNKDHVKFSQESSRSLTKETSSSGSLHEWHVDQNPLGVNRGFETSRVKPMPTSRSSSDMTHINSQDDPNQHGNTCLAEAQISSFMVGTRNFYHKDEVNQDKKLDKTCSQINPKICYEDELLSEIKSINLSNFLTKTNQIGNNTGSVLPNVDNGNHFKADKYITPDVEDQFCRSTKKAVDDKELTTSEGELNQNTKTTVNLPLSALCVAGEKSNLKSEHILGTLESVGNVMKGLEKKNPNANCSREEKATVKTSFTEQIRSLELQKQKNGKLSIDNNNATNSSSTIAENSSVLQDNNDIDSNIFRCDLGAGSICSKDAKTEGEPNKINDNLKSEDCFTDITDTDIKMVIDGIGISTDYSLDMKQEDYKLQNICDINGKDQRNHNSFHSSKTDSSTFEEIDHVVESENLEDGQMVNKVTDIDKPDIVELTHRLVNNDSITVDADLEGITVELSGNVSGHSLIDLDNKLGKDLQPEDTECVGKTEQNEVDMGQTGVKQILEVVGIDSQMSDSTGSDDSCEKKKLKDNLENVGAREGLHMKVDNVRNDTLSVIPNTIEDTPEVTSIATDTESEQPAGCTSEMSKTPSVLLSERFSQIHSKAYDEDSDCRLELYKAEYENIVNRQSACKGKGQASDEVGNGNELMEVDTERWDPDRGMLHTRTSRNVRSINDITEVRSNRRSETAFPDSRPEMEKDMEKTRMNVRGYGENNGSAEPERSDCDSLSNRQIERRESREESSPVSFLDFSDDSDDELLKTPSAFLRSIADITGRPVVITPTKVGDSGQNSPATTSGSDLPPVKPVALKAGVKNKFTLDGLLADHEDNVDLVKEMDEINQELLAEIREGGFANILNREDSSADLHITDEQKEMLKHFEVQESCIKEDRPGLVVFQPQRYLCLFSSMLHPTHCGFVVGSNGLQLEKHLESLNPSHYRRVIASGIISQCFSRISCPTPIMRWLFFIMSVHEDYQVQQGCKKVLLEILHHQHCNGVQKWTPRLIDVLSILVNYGAELESLVQCGSSTLDIIRGKLIQEPGYSHEAVPDESGMNVQNLILVLQVLAQCLYGPSGRYSPNDLSLLCVALCKASLDTSLKNMCAKGAFQNCVTMVIGQYTETDWMKERLKLTRMLVSITDHHHNSAHIAELLPPGQRGMFLQRRYCYLVLSDILLYQTNVSDDVLDSVQVQNLNVFVPKLETLLEEDIYKMSSVVTLIDLCVGGTHISMNSQEREQLKCLFDQVKRVRVRDNVSMLDRTRVKDMMVRMTSKWALDIQTMKGKQTKIFEYASPIKMHIVSVKATQSSDDDDDDGDHSDSDDDVPVKVQKLSPTHDT